MDFNGPREDLNGIEGRRHRRRHTIANFRGGWACHFCGDEVQCAVCHPDTTNAANIDHLLPRARGGADTVENSVIACIPCNEAKEDDYWPDPEKRAILAKKLNTTFLFFNGRKKLAVAV